MEKGYTYVWIMFVVALTGITLAAAGQIWRTEARREKEKELMFVGEQFRQAIGSYYESSPGMPKRYPDSLEKMLSDNRFPTIKRHLRKIFADPMTGTSEWGLVKRPGTGITGIYSLSTQTPLKRANFPERYASFGEAKDYRDWKFIYSPGDAGGTLPQSQPQPGGQPQTQPGRQPQTGPQPGLGGRTQPQSQRPERPLSPDEDPETSPFPTSPSRSTDADSDPDSDSQFPATSPPTLQ
jgi:type II secretory pathway pseudopilin PulG